MTHPVKQCSESLLLPVRLLVFDVDGVLTRGEVIYSAGGLTGLQEAKCFHVRDGLGFGLARAAGLRIAWITGRRSQVVEHRAAELLVQNLHQGARDKAAVLRLVQKELEAEPVETLYMGDDLNDLPAFELAAVRVAPAGAAREALEAANWVTECRGGEGAAREVIDTLLEVQGRLEEAKERFLARLRVEQDPFVQ